MSFSSIRKITLPEQGQPREMDIVCYDTETSSADRRHCQIFQFASIRASMDMVELESHEFRIRRLPYIVPAPGALRVTSVDVRTLDDASLPEEFEAIGKVDSILRTPKGRGRVFLTFNGIAYDDEVIRVALARNLRDSYFNSGRDSVRIDVMPLVQLAIAGGAEGIVPAFAADGKQTWKLEALCLANGITVDAHDALGDARSTLDLARLVRDRAPWAWDIAYRAGNAGRVDKRLAGLAGTDGVIWHFNHYGEPDLAPCVVLGQDAKRRFLLHDLRVPVDIAALEDVDIGDVESRRNAGLRIAKAGSAPLFLESAEITQFPSAMGVEEAVRLGGHSFARKDSFQRSLQAFRAETYAKLPGLTQEQRIYEGFPSYADKDRMAEFHRAATWEQRASIVFEDDRLAEYAARLLAMTVPVSDDLFGYDGGGLADSFRARCQATMDRPYGDASSAWETLAGCFPDADDDWKEWACEVFRVDPDLVAAGTPALVA